MFHPLVARLYLVLWTKCIAVLWCSVARSNRLKHALPFRTNGFHNVASQFDAESTQHIAP